VLTGTLQLSVGEESYVLAQGDSIYFDASMPHSWKNIGPDILEVIWIMTPPHF